MKIPTTHNRKNDNILDFLDTLSYLVSFKYFKMTMRTDFNNRDGIKMKMTHFKFVLLLSLNNSTTHSWIFYFSNKETF